MGLWLWVLANLVLVGFWAVLVVGCDFGGVALGLVRVWVGFYVVFFGFCCCFPFPVGLV